MASSTKMKPSFELKFWVNYVAFLRLISPLLDFILGKQIPLVFHGLKFQVVPARILEKHRPLFPRLPFKAAVRLDDKVDFPLNALDKGVKLRVRENDASVGDRDLVTVNWVVKILAAVIGTSEVADYLVAVEIVVLPLWGGRAGGVGGGARGNRGFRREC